MHHCIHHFETRKNGDGEKRLLLILDVGKFPAYEDSQCNEQDQSTKDVANDRQRM